MDGLNVAIKLITATQVQQARGDVGLLITTAGRCWERIERREYTTLNELHYLVHETESKLTLALKGLEVIGMAGQVENPTGRNGCCTRVGATGAEENSNLQTPNSSATPPNPPVDGGEGR